ncbi:hypothetical protein ACF0H5_003957 [Mactra antiquata]
MSGNYFVVIFPLSYPARFFNQYLNQPIASRVIKDMLCLSPPSYISPWVLMDSDDPSTTFVTFTHGFGEVPIKAEVQVRSPTTGFIYPGVKSSYAGNDANSRGGVICIYNENDVRLYGATNENTQSGTAYIIFTGSLSWTSENQEQSKTGYVRVRVWRPSDLPAPDFTSTGTGMKANGNPWPNYKQLTHSLNVIPELTVVQYNPAFSVPLSGWYSEGQGSSSRPIDNNNLYWGGLVYGVNSNTIQLWTASSGDANYGIFSFCDGWGYDVRGDAVSTMTSDCSYIRAYITIYMWTSLGSTEKFSTSVLHDTSDTLTHEVSVHPLNSINIDDDILTFTVEAVSGANNGYYFPGTGAAMLDNDNGCGGVIYAYSNETSSVRYWHPNTYSSNAGLIHIQRFGGGTNQDLTSDANLHINLYKPGVSVINNCLGVVAQPGVNVNSTLSSGTGTTCVVDYTCYTGHTLVSGDLQMIYDYTTTSWTGTPPDCQPGSGSSFWVSLVGTNTVVNVTGDDNGITAIYQCQTGYNYLSGDGVLYYDQSASSWNGTAMVCQLPLVPPASYSAILNGINTLVNVTVDQDGIHAVYTCLPGYSIVSGDSVIYFQESTGVWNGTALECEIICSNPTTGVSSSYVLSTSLLAPGSLAVYSCNVGFEISTGDTVRACQSNGTWSGNSLTCIVPSTTSTTSSTAPTTSSAAPTTTTTSVATTTTSSPPPTTTTDEPVITVCFNTTTVVNITTILEIAEEIVANLTIDATKTNKHLRTLTSATDGRQSSKVIGTVGAVMCALVIGLMVLPDLFTFIQYLMKCCRHGHGSR